MKVFPQVAGIPHDVKTRRQVREELHAKSDCRPSGGQFQLPASSSEPLVAFRCAPVFRPYLEEDGKDAAFIIDTPIMYKYIQGAAPISLPTSLSHSSQDLVTISIGNHLHTTIGVPVNATGFEFSLDIRSLLAQKTAYNVSCSATYKIETSSSKTITQYFSTNTSLLYLPDTSSSVVKTDLRTGFYISFDQCLAKNLSFIDQLEVDGFNTIRPLPPYDNATIFQQVPDKTTELGLYIVYDMQTNYQNLTAVVEEIDVYSSLPNLLHWKIAREPDASSDPVTTARNTYDLIHQMDGYHPVSIVLNCEDYDFAPYVEGTDIVVQNAYPIGINATFSPVWHTECTPNFGHCSCDNCQGFVHDIKARMQTYKNRLYILGFERCMDQPSGFWQWSFLEHHSHWPAMGCYDYDFLEPWRDRYDSPKPSWNSH
ncbi:hypothetical protein PAXINDRAFT_103852 [Paxillus involutus ATCC 200175]|uniref:Uncharacterized protein n=1 Tax=Paxillus involutus ATCC 200175 TaxID=664439 RepID=A0A0C9T171_PAXIN|nr:hypothetical protein PAXINDRAFT_103852 [Paxillus involutus ATCC 200175]